MNKRSKYQEKVIRNYYDNRDAIAIQRLQELITELYLTSGKKRQQHWKNIVTHLQNLKVPQDHIDHLLKEDNAELVANYVKKLASP